MEWLFEQLSKIDNAWKNERIDGLEYNKQKYEAHNKAKELHKQEIMDAWLMDSVINTLDKSFCKDLAEQYYKDTYETDN